mmetsp:Transcript_18500/g.33141  ORF Transcript_18500/g.33141 Transcript_18500/m.33141 type:complete len:216 (-) Transcript_18500:379-1026(-)
MPSRLSGVSLPLAVLRLFTAMLFLLDTGRTPARAPARPTLLRRPMPPVPVLLLAAPVPVLAAEPSWGRATAVAVAVGGGACCCCCCCFGLALERMIEGFFERFRLVCLSLDEASTARACAGVSGGPPVLPFLQPTHLQVGAQGTPAWKHSQYFLRQADFLQLQPLMCLLAPLSIFLFFPRKNALASLSSVMITAFDLSNSYFLIFRQSTQLQPLQ